jgi:hypothetical protein
LLLFAASTTSGAEPARLRVAVSYPESLAKGPLDGRLLLLLSTDPSAEPRFQISDTDIAKSQQVFGIDVEGWKPGEAKSFDASILGYPAESLGDVKPGRYRIQALLHVYETFRRADGHVVKLPMDRGEGQQWNRAPGNLLSTPREVEVDPARAETLRVDLDSTIPEIKPPADTKFVKHIRIQSERLTKFWGRPMHLGAVVLLPAGFDEHPQARFPLAVFHGHFPYTMDDFREEAPDPNIKCEYSSRFQLDCYNRIQQELGHQLFKDWTAADFPRFLVVEIQHANPYYDDSYAVNSQNLGPYGDAIQYELVPEIEKRFRGIGQGWARLPLRRLDRRLGSARGADVLPGRVERLLGRVPRPDRLPRLHDDRHLLGQERLLVRGAVRPHRAAQPSQLSRPRLGDDRELQPRRARSRYQEPLGRAVRHLGGRLRSVGSDGYPKRLWDKRTGVIDPAVASFAKENYDLRYILQRDWSKGLGKKLQGKVNIYVGDMDNYYLNNAVYLTEDFLKTTDPPYGGEVDYGDRAEHCWNGDHTRSNAYSRLRYIQMHAPKMMKRIEATAPPGADTKSWRY